MLSINLNQVGSFPLDNLGKIPIAFERYPLDVHQCDLSSSKLQIVLFAT